MSAEMKGLLLNIYTPQEFDQYVSGVVAKKMAAWRPRGGVLHNTGPMSWPMAPKGSSLKPTKVAIPQLIKNASVAWVEPLWLRLSSPPSPDALPRRRPLGPTR